MLEELTPSHIVQFRGLFAKGLAEVCPLEYFDIAENLRYITGGFETRFGTTLSDGIPAGVRRFFPYAIEGQVDRTIFLTNAGQIFDSLYPETPILVIPGMIDFSMIVLNDRAYISPHNGKTGMPGEKIYIYQGSGIPARPAGGSPPSGFSLTAEVSPNSGNVEAGIHFYAIAYETDSGFITRPGPQVYPQLYSDGTFKVIIKNIQPGPAGTVARHILATAIVEPSQWDGNQESPELFFVEDATIYDNVTTEKEINFYDSQLLRSADYLKDEMTTIPAVLGFTSYAGSLVGWAPNEEPSSVYLSKAGEPESISLIEGAISVEPTIGGGVTNCVEYRGAALMIHKAGAVYSTMNNGEEPVYWKVDKVDTAIGTSVFGVAAILDEEGNTVDRYVFASKQGLIAYEGNFENNLSEAISEYWGRINKKQFHKIQVVLDPINSFIAITAPFDGATECNRLLYCDYSAGLNATGVKWSVWTFNGFSPTSIGIDVNLYGEPMFKIGAREKDIYYLDPSAQGDNYQTIPQPTFRTAFVGDNEAAVNQYGGIRLRAFGTGALNLQFSGLDEVISILPAGFVLSMTPGRLLQREFNLLSQLGHLKVWTSNYGDRFKITRISLYHTPVFFEEPA